MLAAQFQQFFEQFFDLPAGGAAGLDLLFELLGDGGAGQTLARAVARSPMERFTLFVPWSSVYS